jgi:glycine/D-amino acid oxidase-like deaminating enzyme/nitrite reductase/ring-hydroxylating ferredoxin subunit
MQNSKVTESGWRATAKLTPRNEVLAAGHFDAIVLGGGITGLTAASLLTAAGKRVAVLEMRTLGSGETGNTTAHLTELADCRYHRAESSFGEEGARVLRESSRAAIELIAQKSARFNCQFERLPAFLYIEAADEEQNTQRNEAELAKELVAAKRAGVDVSLTADVPLPFGVKNALRVENQAQFHPLKYLAGLADEVVAQGGKIYEHVKVIAVDDGAPCKVKTESGVELSADHVLVCANVPVIDKLLMHTKLLAYRTYAVAAEFSAKVPEGLYFDMAEPYHYIRPHVFDGQQLLIVGGEDHGVGLSSTPEIDHFATLIAYAKVRFGIGAVKYRWSGQVIEPADGFPYIGRNPAGKNVLVATGFAGSGITMGTFAAQIMSDMALGKANPWEKFYDATRAHLTRALGGIMHAGFEFGAHRVDGWLRTARGELSQIAPGQGKVIVVKRHRLAVYRDDVGALHALEPSCTHMGCQVNWNGAEKSWDCPCHGGRYDIAGRVLNGPPVHDLERVELPADVENS